MQLSISFDIYFHNQRHGQSKLSVRTQIAQTLEPAVLVVMMMMLLKVLESKQN